MARGGAIGLGVSGRHKYARMVRATYPAAMTRACRGECGRLSDRGRFQQAMRVHPACLEFYPVIHAHTCRSCLPYAVRE